MLKLPPYTLSGLYTLSRGMCRQVVCYHCSSWSQRIMDRTFSPIIILIAFIYSISIGSIDLYRQQRTLLPHISALRLMTVRLSSALSLTIQPQQPQLMTLWLLRLCQWPFRISTTAMNLIFWIKSVMLTSDKPPLSCAYRLSPVVVTTAEAYHCDASLTLLQEPDMLLIPMLTVH